jgi:hypothetical protein
MKTFSFTFIFCFLFFIGCTPGIFEIREMGIHYIPSLNIEDHDLFEASDFPFYLEQKGLAFDYHEYLKDKYTKKLYKPYITIKNEDLTNDIPFGRSKSAIYQYLKSNSYFTEIDKSDVFQMLDEYFSNITVYAKMEIGHIYLYRYYFDSYQVSKYNKNPGMQYIIILIRKDKNTILKRLIAITNHSNILDITLNVDDDIDKLLVKYNIPSSEEAKGYIYFNILKDFFNMLSIVQFPLSENRKADISDFSKYQLDLYNHLRDKSTIVEKWYKGDEPQKSQEYKNLKKSLIEVLLSYGIDENIWSDRIDDDLRVNLDPYLK